MALVSTYEISGESGTMRGDERIRSRDDMGVDADDRKSSLLIRETCECGDPFFHRTVKEICELMRTSYVFRIPELVYSVSDELLLHIGIEKLL